MPAPWGSYLSLARFCLAINHALRVFLDGPDKPKIGGFHNINPGSRIGAALRFLNQFTEEGMKSKKLPEYTEYSFWNKDESGRRLTSSQIGLIQDYIKMRQNEFELTVRNLKLISEKWPRLKSRKTKERIIQPCTGFFLDLLYRCIWAMHFGVN